SDFTSVICESDVTWSPLTNKGFDRVLFFDLPCFSQCNRISYASSISNTVLNEEQEKDFSDLLYNYDYLSSREFETAKYVENLTGKNCEWVLDPVLLLDKKDYIPYMKDINFNNYVLIYNCMKNDKKLIKSAREFAKKNKLKVLEISDYNQNKVKYNHKVMTNLGVEEFLYAFNNATYIFTNGFHGVCFSIIFKKEFFIFARDGFDIKLKSLVNLFGFHERFIE